MCWVLAAAMLLRALGDFRYVGFFKRVRTGRFAELDTKFYTPLCLALAAGAGWTALKYSYALLSRRGGRVVYGSGLENRRS